MIICICESCTGSLAKNECGWTVQREKGPLIFSAQTARYAISLSAIVPHRSNQGNRAVVGVELTHSGVWAEDIRALEQDCLGLCVYNQQELISNPTQRQVTLRLMWACQVTLYMKHILLNIPYKKATISHNVFFFLLFDEVLQ